MINSTRTRRARQKANGLGPFNAARPGRTGGVPSAVAPASYTGPLDIVPGAVVAYSVRALKAAWIDEALYTLQRTGGGDTQQQFDADAEGDSPVATIDEFLEPFFLDDSFSIQAAGSGYPALAFPELTLVGGTFTTPAVAYIETDASGIPIATDGTSEEGEYSVVPSNPVATTADVGSGCTLNAVWDQQDYTPGSLQLLNDQAGGGYNMTPDNVLSQSAWNAGAIRPYFNLNSESVNKTSDFVTPIPAGARTYIFVAEYVETAIGLELFRTASSDLSVICGINFDAENQLYVSVSDGVDSVDWYTTETLTTGTHLIELQFAANGNLAVLVDGAACTVNLDGGGAISLTEEDATVRIINNAANIGASEFIIWPQQNIGAPVRTNITTYYGITLS